MDLLQEELETVRLYLNRAKEAGMTVEVVLWAMNELKYNSNMSIADAFYTACWEWDV